ncbi:MAG: OmpA family protein [Chitinophagaceae bacterium]|nr:OmpA family protein [Chitinophagaceae bacterium]
MKKLLFLFIFAICCTVLSSAQENDAPGCKDSPMFNRMPNTAIGECSSNYDEQEIPMGPERKDKKEGTRTHIQYNYELEEATAPSFLQIVKNFENAIVKAGGKRIYFSGHEGVATLFTRSAGKDVWVVLYDFGGTKKGNFELDILEMEEMKQDIQASELLEAINKNGSIALYINFETGKSDIKSESQNTVNQVADMLLFNKEMKVSIEGHTDNVGTPASNKTLSENRAKAVMNALILRGVDKSRLSAKGWGQEKPITDNKTDEGKAKNRRVEIVKL